MFKKILLLSILLLVLGNVFSLSDTNLTAYWSFDETSGTNLIDVYDFDENGTNTGSVPITATGIIGYSYGDFANNKYITLGNHPSGLNNAYNQPMSVCAWVNLTSTGGNSNYVYNAGAQSNLFETSLSVDSSGIASFNVNQSGVAGRNALSNSALSTGTWYFLCGTFNGTSDTNEIKLYVNGVLQDDKGTWDLGAISSSSYQTWIGNYNNPSENQPFKGKIDEMSWWNKTLNQTDITELYNSGNGNTYPFTGVFADFNYYIDKQNAEIDFIDNSSTIASTITDWNWIINNVLESNDQNFSYPTTTYTDINACLIVNDDENNNSSKCSQFNTGNFYGNLNLVFYDENSESLLNDITINSNTSINGETEWTLTDTNTTDLNLQGITTGTYTFTFSKTGYGTRYYTIDLNQYVDLNIVFALLPSSLSIDVPLKVYKTDETTIYSNVYVEMYLPSSNWTVGRNKTNTQGETTFNLHISDQNYYANINNGTYTYIPVALTILYPKNEDTLAQITENWRIDITQNLYISYTDLNTDKIIYLLPNTGFPFNIKIQDMNENYFSRTYAKQYPGNPLTDTLQPYLVPIDTGLLTTITTKDSYTNTAIGGITIKIYKFISGLGRTLVEELLTDDKGQALSLLTVNDDYEFEIYQDAELIKEFSITATSSTIIIYITLPVDIPIITPSGFNVSFNPIVQGILNQATGTKTFTQTIYNLGNDNATYLSQIIQNGTILATNTTTSSASTQIINLNVNWADINNGTLISKVTITYDGNTIYRQMSYNITDPFDTNYNIIDGLRLGLRQDFYCSTTPDGIGLYPLCIPLLGVAIFISIILVIWASALTGSFSGQATGIIFALPLILFTYLTWVPLELTVGVIILLLAFIVYERR